MLSEDESGAAPASLAELKAYLRIDGTGEDAMLEGLLRGAGALCERFIGQWLIVRGARETMAAGAGWQRLSARPVIAVEAVAAVDSAGVETALAVDGYAVDIDASGDGWVRVTGGGPVSPGAARLVAVTYRAGLAEGLDGVPEPLRQGIVRLAADHYLARGGDAATPPAVVSALWRPWRRMRLA
jgi:uncharacterized phiE125 gp8 family phage protein